MKTETMQDLYFKELRDLYGSEKTILKSLPKMMERAELPELRQALANHLNETRGHATRLEKIFEIHGQKPSIKNDKALEGILHEGEQDIADSATPSVRDAAILAAAQQVEHYEIAAYGTLQTYATHLGHSETGKLLQATLDEERAADRKLTEIALNHLKIEVTHNA
jgi:ferritin-like metal-binding protein YciE